MKYRSNVLIFTAFLCLLSCKTEQKKAKEVEKNVVEVVEKNVAMLPTEAEKIIDAAIEAHGGSLYDEASYSFVFRKKKYTFHNTQSKYTYTVKHTEKGNEIYDVLENGKLTRTLNGAITELSAKEDSKYKEALNSVVYFATLPHKLNDKAVQKKYIGDTSIKGMQYKIVEITFGQEGGGKDFDDEFYYWINETTNRIDYLAYSYATNGGGVRFRSAYNVRKVEGIYFQDYINWEAPVGTPLAQLPSLYEEGKLNELSRILTEDIVHLK